MTEGSSNNTTVQQPPAPSVLSRFPLRSYCKASDIITGGLLALNWALPLYSLRNLPERIPMQYSLNGAINWSGSKYLALVIPLSATINYLSHRYITKDPKRTLYPITLPENPQKTDKLVTIFSKTLGVIVQDALLAASILLIKGIDLTEAQRGKWIKAGMIAVTVTFAANYLGIRYLRDH